MHEVLPAGVNVTLLADRGFGDQKLYEMLRKLRFGYIIRFRDVIFVSDSSGKSLPAAEWASNGRARMLRKAFVTKDNCPVPAVVCVKEAGMKENWCRPPVELTFNLRRSCCCTGSASPSRRIFATPRI